MAVYARLPGRSAEEAIRVARGAAGRQGQDTVGGLGFAIDGDLLAIGGSTIVALLEATGPVAVLAPLGGDPERVGGAARRYALAGAAWLTIAASSGIGAITSAGEAVKGTGCGIAIATLSPEVDEAESAALTGGSRGRAVSRMVQVGVAAGANGVICSVQDLGVIVTVAPDVARIVETRDVDHAVEAIERGASVVVCPDVTTAAAVTSRIEG